MADDLKDFAKKIRQVGKNVALNSSTEVRKLALKIGQILVVETPVATGRARNNWFATLSLPFEGTVDAEVFDKTGQARIAENAAEISKHEGDQTIYISNNLPYISKLNEGSSAQAPAGFVEAAVAVAEDSMKKIDLLKEPD